MIVLHQTQDETPEVTTTGDGRECAPRATPGMYQQGRLPKMRELLELLADSYHEVVLKAQASHIDVVCIVHLHLCKSRCWKTLPT